MKICTAILLSALLCDPLPAAGPESTSRERETPERRAERLQWWNSARFGMFVHWGVYSVTGGLSKSGQKIELTILPSPHAVGPHNVADIQGDDHDIVFHRSDGPIDTDRRPIVVTGDDSTIRNETEYPIVLKSSASGNTVVSFGPVTDLGTDNNVSRFRQLKSSEH